MTEMLPIVIKRSFYKSSFETEEAYHIEVTREIARMRELGYEDTAGEPIERIVAKNIGYTITFEKRGN